MTFCKLLYHRKCKRRGVGGQKKPNLVNVVCERPLMQMNSLEKRLELSLSLCGSRLSNLFSTVLLENDDSWRSPNHPNGILKKFFGIYDSYKITALSQLVLHSMFQIMFHRPYFP